MTNTADVSVSPGHAEFFVEHGYLVVPQLLTADEVEIGRSETLRYFVEKAFAHFGLDWQRHVELDNAMLRPSDIMVSRASADRTRQELNWTATSDVDIVIARMCRDEL